MAKSVRTRLSARKSLRGGIFLLALLILGIVGSAGASGSEKSVLGVPCSQALAQHLDMQLNVHAFLVSSDADFVSGVTIPVTGGQLGGMG